MDDKIKYPCYMTDCDEMIILFYEDRVGVIIDIGMDSSKKFGEHSDDWNMELFKPFCGEIIINPTLESLLKDKKRKETFTCDYCTYECKLTMDVEDGEWPIGEIGCPRPYSGNNWKKLILKQKNKGIHVRNLEIETDYVFVSNMHCPNCMSENIMPNGSCHICQDCGESIGGC